MIPINAGFTRGWCRPFLTCIALAAITLTVFGPAMHYGFVSFDDNVFVDRNPELQRGLSASGLRWAFTANLFSHSPHAEFWEPLTLITRLLDYQLYGSEAGGQHLTSVLIHIASGLALLGALHTLTGTFWRSAFVAALFLIHPMHVEPVVWLSARKDLVSGLFMILSIWTYGAYAKKRNLYRYLILFLACLAANMAKPMAVSLPFLFFILDFWPAQTLRKATIGIPGRIQNLVIEKIPFFLLSVFVSLLAVRGQKAFGAFENNELIPIPWRVGNAILATGTYLLKAFAPVNLAVYYPHPAQTLDLLLTTISAIALLSISAIAVLNARRSPWIAAGWSWFIVVLAPVSGIIQIGDQAMADRYSYIAFIGLFIAVTWEVAAWTGRAGWMVSRSGRTAVIAAASGVVVTMALLASFQTRIWKDDITLFSHALKITKNNYRMEFNLGNSYWSNRQRELAIPHLEAAVAIRKPVLLRQIAASNAATTRGDFQTAADNLKRVLMLMPWDAGLHYELGGCLKKMGQPGKARDQFLEALKFQPNWPPPRVALIELAIEAKETEEATRQLEELAHRNPAAPEAVRLQQLIDDMQSAP